jgi:hypothetical protein
MMRKPRCESGEATSTGLETRVPAAEVRPRYQLEQDFPKSPRNSRAHVNIRNRSLRVGYMSPVRLNRR